jgi:hypothetical protein
MIGTILLPRRGWLIALASLACAVSALGLHANAARAQGVFKCTDVELQEAGCFVTAQCNPRISPNGCLARTIVIATGASSCSAIVFAPFPPGQNGAGDRPQRRAFVPDAFHVCQGDTGTVDFGTGETALGLCLGDASSPQTLVKVQCFLVVTPAPRT